MVAGILRYLRRSLGLPVYWLSHLVPRSPVIWVFGAWFGQRFADNPKYLYLYVKRAVPWVRPIWICARSTDAEDLRRSGVDAEVQWSLRGIWAQLRAGVFVVCVGLDDVVRALTGGALVVNLWHGVPLKRIGADDDRFSHVGRGLLRPLWSLRNRLILAEWGRYQAMPATSEEVKTKFCQAFRLPDDRVPILGFPRNDLLVEGGPAVSSQRAALLSSCNLPSEARTRIIAYLPTHRREGRARVAAFPLRGFEAASLESLLIKQDAVVVYKGHFYHSDQGDVSEGGAITRFRDLTQTLLDVQPLLAVADVLITDLSSCYFDFLLRDRPIIFIRSTVDSYLKEERGLYYDYEAVTPGSHVSTHEEFLVALERALQDPKADSSRRHAVLKQFHTHCDAGSSARVYAHIAGLVGMSPKPERPVHRVRGA